MNLALPHSIASPQDISALILDIKDYSRWYEHELVKRKVSAPTTSEQPKVSDEAAQIVRDWASQQPLSLESLSQLIDTLESWQREAHVMTITLAAPAPGSLKKQLVEWCRSNLSATILVNFRYNSTILGGMVVRYGSHIYDWSFRRELTNNRHKLPEILNRV